MVNIFLTIILYTSLIGYSILGKLIIIDIIIAKNTNSKKEFRNLDIIIGIFALALFSIIINIFYPLKNISFLVIILGLINFFLFFKKFKFKFSFVLLFLLIIFFNLIITYNPLATDSHVYHLQIIKWYHNYKTIIGLAQLESRFGLNSIWHYILGLIYYDFKGSNTIYLFNLIPFIALFNEVFNLRKKDISKFSNKFISACVFFILIFTVIHPYPNGTILSLLGSPEVDTPGMIFFIICVYYFIKIFEKNSYQNFYFFAITSSLCLSIKLSYVICLILFFYIIFINKEFTKSIKKLSPIFVLIFFWIFQSYLNSGCLIFPINHLCFNVSWGFNSETLNHFKDFDITAFVRSKNNPVNYLDSNYYLNSNEWVLPWIKNYLLKSSFFLINLTTIFFSILILAYNLLTKQNKIFPKKIYIGLTFFIIIFIIVWSKAPEFRYSLGIFISITCIIFSISISFYQKLIGKFFFLNKVSIIMLFCVLFFNNFNEIFKKPNQFTTSRIYDYKKFIFSHQENDFNFYLPNTTCALFEKICTYSEKKNLRIIKINNYYLIQNKLK